MFRTSFLFATVLAVCIIATGSMKAFPKRGIYYTSQFLLLKGEKPILMFQGFCSFILVVEEQNRYVGYCPDDNTTAVGFYNHETHSLGGAWELLAKKLYGSFSYTWNGTYLKGPFSVYPLETGYTFSKFVKELPPGSNDIPTV